jgi:hypothetical protein
VSFTIAFERAMVTTRDGTTESHRGEQPADLPFNHLAVALGMSAKSLNLHRRCGDNPRRRFSWYDLSWV